MSRPPCADNPDLFFPDHKELGAAAHRLALLEAKAICSTCPLIEACREAGENEPYGGVWGGVYHREISVSHRGPSKDWTHCKRGHLYAENLIPNAKGISCGRCHNASKRASQRRTRAQRSFEARSARGEAA
jgi:hypothetical protein